MSTFTIDTEDNITAYPSAADATECNPGVAQFDSLASLANISAEWPLSRFVEIWNSIPGNAEVKKFQDRKKAVTRIWTAIQRFASGDQSSDAKAERPARSRKSTKKAKPAKKAAPARKGTAKDRVNKKAEVIALMKRAKV